MGNVFFIEDVCRMDVSAVGKKAATLGELKQEGINILPGLVLTTSAYREFIVTSGIHERIIHLLRDLEKEGAVKTSQKLKELVRKRGMPEGLSKEIDEKKKSIKTKRWMVRASSVDGRNRCAVYNVANDGLHKAVKECWASIYDISALKEKKVRAGSSVAVVVQPMVFADKAGEIYSKDSSNFNLNIVYGLSAVMDKGVKGHSFVIDKDTLIMKAKEFNEQEFGYMEHWKGNRLIKREVLKKQPLLNKELKEITETAKKVENHYGHPQRIDFLLDDRTNNFYITGCRKVS